MAPKNLILLITIIFAAIYLSFAKPSKNIELKCGPTDYKCYENYYSQIVKNIGVKTAFDDLKDRYNKDNFAKAFCHPLVHAIGRAASEKFKTPGEAFVYGDNFCSSGYYHGVLEGIAGRMGRDTLLANLNSVCTDIRGKKVYSLDYYNCVHGLGHGLMAITDDELFESLKDCEKLTGDWEQKSCASGVFMENIVVDGLNHQTKYLKKDNLLYPCNQTSEKFKSTCYLMQSSYILQQSSFSFEKTFEICSQAETNYKSKCYQSLGRDASGFTTSDLSKTKDICLLGKNFDQKLGCMIGAAKDFKYYFGNETQAKKLCESAQDQLLIQPCLKEI